MHRTMFTLVPVICLATSLSAQPTIAAHSESSVEVRISSSEADETIRDITTVIRRFENGDELRVHRRNGELRVQLNGEDVPDERLRQARGRTVVLDAEGNEQYAIRFDPDGGITLGDARQRGRVPGGGRIAPPSPPGAGVGPPSPPGPPSPRAGRAPTGVFGGPGAGPGAMHEEWRIAAELALENRGQIGITMGRIDAALAAHLQLDPDGVVLITNVREGAPAHQSGLRPHDIIIKLNGESPVTQQRIRQHVRDKEPGDEITFTVLRAGQEHEFTVEIRPIERRGFGGSISPDQARERAREWRGLDLRRLQDMEAEELAAALQEHLGSDQWRRQFRRLRERSDEQLAMLRESLKSELESALELEMTDELREKIERIARIAQGAIEWAAEHGVVLGRQLDVELPPAAFRFEGIQPFHQFFQFDDRDAPPIMFFREDDGTGVVVRPPDAPRAPRRAEAAERADERFSRLEDRLDRLERMIERLLERP
jgi:hypothetical protein